LRNASAVISGMKCSPKRRFNMSRREPLTRLRHMLDYSREAVSMAAGKTRADLDANRMLALALVRALEVIGEAAAQIPLEARSQYPSIRWQGIVGLRNRLISSLRRS
ncbi:MAG: HepT-like ribonuclease domain-containing protein, partial [Candidatus Acidiferrales bacterium]